MMKQFKINVIRSLTKKNNLSEETELKKNEKKNCWQAPVGQLNQLLNAGGSPLSSERAQFESWGDDD